MAEIMTYDPGTDTVTTGDTLTADEQNSLEVGQALEEQQEAMLAGKYKNAEELEKAYIELEKKLGSDGQKEDDNIEAEQEEVLQEESEEDSSQDDPAVALLNEANNEYFANDGSLSDETLAKFSSLSSQDLVNAYIEFTKNNPQQQQSVDMSSGDVNVVQNSVGGEQAYGEITAWAAQNLDSRSIDAFDSVVESGNVQAIQLAVAGLKAQFDEANGYEGRMLSGKAPSVSGDVYKSQPELVAAMSDPRYDSDPAYRRSVMEKLDRSDLSF